MNHRPKFWIDLRLVKRRPQFWDSEDIGNARALHRIVRIDQTGVVECAPGDYAGVASDSGCFAVCLGVPESLLLLYLHVASAAVLAIKTFAVAVIELSNRF